MTYTEFQNELLKRYGRGESEPTYYTGFPGYVIVKTETLKTGRILSNIRVTPVETIEPLKKDGELSEYQETDIEFFLDETEAKEFFDNNYSTSEVTPYCDTHGSPLVKIIEYFLEPRCYEWNNDEEEYCENSVFSSVGNCFGGRDIISHLPAPVEHIFFSVCANREKFPGDVRRELKKGCTFDVDVTMGFNPKNEYYDGRNLFNNLDSAMNNFMYCCGGKSKVTKSGGRVNFPDGNHIDFEVYTAVIEYYVKMQVYKYDDNMREGYETVNMFLAISDMPAIYYNEAEPFSEQIKEARKKCGLSQAALSRLLKIPERTIAHWEAGENQPPSWAAELLLEKLSQRF